MMTHQHKKCLVLNGDYSPIEIINWQQSVIWYFKNKNNTKCNITIVEYYQNDYIKGSLYKIQLPAVIKINKYFNLKNNIVNFSRKNLFIRDEYMCQYCNKNYDIRELTYDHVIPKCLWKNKAMATCWKNIVTCCIACNRRKGSRTPEQAGMTLKVKPFIPKRSTKYLPITHKLRIIKEEIPSEWSFYIPKQYINNENIYI